MVSIERQKELREGIPAFVAEYMIRNRMIPTVGEVAEHFSASKATMQGLFLYNQVFIVDDIPINNPELIPYKEFCLKAYYYRFKEWNSNSYFYGFNIDNHT